MIPELTQAGVLPLGRYPTTITEVAARFAPEGCSARRAKVFAHWELLTRAVREAAGGLPAIWMAGSFTTDKADPGDVDAVYLIEDHRSRAWLPRAQQVLDMVARQTHGLLVDSFILDWRPDPGASMGDEEYLKYRGYWDELWSRCRHPDPRVDAMPDRGYLEVIVDGYR